MIIWLWDVGHCHGVAGDDTRARQAAGECIIGGRADTATVEAATLALGVSSVEDAYARTGTGWTGRRTDRGVRWTPLTVPATS